MSQVCLRAFFLVGLVSMSLGCGSKGSQTPAGVAEAYMRAGAAENNAEVLANLDPACASNEAMTRVDSARVLGVPITIETLTVTIQSETEQAATVQYTVSGSAHGEGGTTMILGATVETGEVNVEHTEQSGALSLVRKDGRWLVGCP